MVLESILTSVPNQEEEPFNPLYLDIEEEYPNPYENPYEEAEDDVADYYTKTFVEIYKKHTPEIVVRPPPPGWRAWRWNKKEY